MCGSLKHENVKHLIGTIIPAKGEVGSFQGKWTGHARSETLEKWTVNGWKVGHIAVTGFTEGKANVKYNIPEGRGIKIIYQEQIKVGNAHPFHIVTRAAISEREKQVHPRFPVLVKLGV